MPPRHRSTPRGRKVARRYAGCACNPKKRGKNKSGRQLVLPALPPAHRAEAGAVCHAVVPKMAEAAAPGPPPSGTILWAQVSGFPYWPAQVIGGESVVEYAKFLSLHTEKGDGEFTVRNFSTKSVENALLLSCATRASSVTKRPCM